MFDRIKDWWKDDGQDLVGTLAVAITALALVYFIISGTHWLVVSFLGWTGLSSVVKTIVTFSFAYTAVLLYYEWRDHREDLSDASNLFHDEYDPDEDPRWD